MTGGNQRDLARMKNQKKQQEMQKKKTASEKTGLSLSERKHRYIYLRLLLVFTSSYIFFN